MTTELARESRVLDGARTLLRRLRALAGRTVRFAQRAADRALHRWRREAALRRLRQAPAPKTLLVVCYGNILRSPYAALRIEEALRANGHSTRVLQGGLLGPDRASHAEAVEAAAARGVSMSAHRSRLITPADIAAADLFIVMEAWHGARLLGGRSGGRILVLGDLDPGPITSRAIIDPYGGDTELFGETYARIDRCLAALVENLPQPPSARSASSP